MTTYTLHFITYHDQILLLNRTKSPAMGLWNGVGGKKHENESLLECVVRETEEETGLHLENPTYAGEMVIKDHSDLFSIHLFVTPCKERPHLATPLATDEGTLEWHPIEWVLQAENQGIVSNLRIILPYLLKGYVDQRYTFEYEKDRIVAYQISQIEEVTQS